MVFGLVQREFFKNFFMFSSPRSTARRTALSSTPSASATSEKLLPRMTQASTRRPWAGGQTVQRVPQTAEPLLELQNLVRGELAQAGGILNAVLAVQRILRLVAGEPPLVCRLIADTGPESLGHIVRNFHIFILGVPVVKVAQVDDSHCMYLHIVFVVWLPGNDMEGGGERHPGEPVRTLGLFVPK